MAKFRQNHTRSGKRPFAGLMIRVLLMLLIFAVLFVLAYQYGGQLVSDREKGRIDFNIVQDNLIPLNHSEEVIEHQYFTLGYDESTEQARWVVYELTRESLKIPNVPRAKRFEEDPLVSSRSARHSDYTGSGYTRGHLAPAGDMAFSDEAMAESFYMSNMSPQVSGFNGGVWRELEESVRDWAYKYERLYVGTGPLFTKVTKSIGRSSQVRIPDAFYKVIIDYSSATPKGIGFVIPHEVTDKQLSSFATTIDQVEELTDLDFFDKIYDSDQDEIELEGEFEIGQWPLSKKRYENRIQNWNHQ